MSNIDGRPRTSSQAAFIPMEVPVSTPDSLEESSSDLRPGMADMRVMLDEGGKYPSYWLGKRNSSFPRK